MRKIKTLNGDIFTGRNNKFEDRGDYIEQINTFSSIRINKKNIVSDKTDNREAIALAAGIAVAVVSGGTIIL